MAPVLYFQLDDAITESDGVTAAVSDILFQVRMWLTSI